MQTLFILTMIAFSFPTIAAPRANCTSVSFDQFFYLYKTQVTSADGPNFDIDLTDNQMCVAQGALCGQGTVQEEDRPGYYQAHTTYFIQVDGQILFAKSSEYLDGTYGNLHGSPTAKEDWNAAYSKLKAQNRCL